MSVLEEAEKLVSKDRQAIYGHPIVDLTRTAKMWEAILGTPISAEQVALCMMAVKISRLCQTPSHIDSVVDIAGYAGVYALVREKR